MFGKLREKLKDALTVFSKKTEEEAEVKQVEVEVNSENVVASSVATENIETESLVDTIQEEIIIHDKTLETKPVIDEIVVKDYVKVSVESAKKGFFSKIFGSKPAEQMVVEQKNDDDATQAEVIVEDKKNSLEVNKDAVEQKQRTVEQKEGVVEERRVDSVKDASVEIKPPVEQVRPQVVKQNVVASNVDVVHKKADVVQKKVETIQKKVEIVPEVKVVKKEDVVVPSPKKVPDEVVEPKGFFSKLKQAITTKTISEEKFLDLFWDLELALLENNVSVEVIEKIKLDLVSELVDKPLPRDVEGKIMETLKGTLSSILTMDSIPLLERVRAHAAEKTGKPYVIAFFGINGAGKTTSVAKLAHYLQKNGRTVVLAACDTFRAAAIQQLEEHAVKLNCKIIKQDYGSDAAAVAFDAIKYAEKNGVDVVLIDTAGRLHSNTNLMSELEKIIRITKPNLKIFVGESITGNDCIEQAMQFNNLVQMDGAILTKADVDEKGGAPISIAYVIKKPILFLGVGQTYDDFEPFDREKILKHLGL